MVTRSRLDGMGRHLAYVLRHHPEDAGITLAYGGWAEVDDVLCGLGWSRDELLDVVSHDAKGRHEVSEDGHWVRALHGHSVDVDLGYVPQRPPATLCHGTADRFLSSIMAEGLLPMGRQFVHLSESVDEAVLVGGRHGRPVVLAVDAQGMADDGYTFFRSGDGVWLVEAVPVRFLSRTD